MASDSSSSGSHDVYNASASESCSPTIVNKLGTIQSTEERILEENQSLAEVSETKEEDNHDKVE